MTPAWREISARITPRADPGLADAVIHQGGSSRLTADLSANVPNWAALLGPDVVRGLMDIEMTRLRL